MADGISLLYKLFFVSLTVSRTQQQITGDRYSVKALTIQTSDLRPNQYLHDNAASCISSCKPGAVWWGEIQFPAKRALRTKCPGFILIRPLPGTPGGTVFQVQLNKTFQIEMDYNSTGNYAMSEAAKDKQCLSKIMKVRIKNNTQNLSLCQIILREQKAKHLIDEQEPCGIKIRKSVDDYCLDKVIPCSPRKKKAFMNCVKSLSMETLPNNKTCYLRAYDLFDFDLRYRIMCLKEKNVTFEALKLSPENHKRKLYPLIREAQHTNSINDSHTLVKLLEEEHNKWICPIKIQRTPGGLIIRTGQASKLFLYLMVFGPGTFAAIAMFVYYLNMRITADTLIPMSNEAEAQVGGLGRILTPARMLGGKGTQLFQAARTRINSIFGRASTVDQQV